MTLTGLTASPQELGPARDLSFTATVDGTTQRYVERLPPGFDPEESHHLLIALHGHGSDRWQYATATSGSPVAARAVAAKYGMILASPDYRAKTSWMGPEAEADVVQLIALLRERHRVGNVFLVGGSMGWSSVLTFTALHPELVAGVCSCNGTANHLEYERFQDAIRASFGGTKREVPLEYKKRSAEYFPERFTMPVAITAGGRDTSVPPDSVVRLAGILRKLGRKVLLIFREQGGHSTTPEDAATALEFVVHHALGLPAPPGSPGSGTGGVFFADDVPDSLDAAGTVELGLRFRVSRPGRITALRFYQAIGETGSHALRLWDGDGHVRVTAEAPATEGHGWVVAPLREPLPVDPGQTWVVAYTARSHYVATAGVFATPVARNGIAAEAGLYSFEDLGKTPGKTYKQMSYFLDVDYEPAQTDQGR